MYLVGTVEAGYGFFFLILYYSLVNDKWILLPIIIIFGCLTNEAFLALVSAFILFTLMQQSLSCRRLSLSKASLFILMMVSGSVTVVVLNYLVYGFVEPPTALLSKMVVNMDPPDFDFGLFLMRSGTELVRFSFTLGLLVFISLFSVRNLPPWFLAGNIGAIFMVASLIAYMILGGRTSMSGSDLARFIYSPVALILCSASAATICKLTTKLHR